MRAFLLSTLILGACAAEDGFAPPPPPEATGAARVHVTTTGLELDQDGYSLLFDGIAVGTLWAQGEGPVLDLPVGTHSVQLGGRAPGCHAAGGLPSSLRILPDDTLDLDLLVRCGDFAASVSLHAGGEGATLYPAEGGPGHTILRRDLGLTAGGNFTKDGTGFLFSGVVVADPGAAFDVYRFDLRDGTIEGFVKGPGFVDQLSTSPDGRRLAYSACTAADCPTAEIRVMDIQTGVIQAHFKRAGALDLWPVWSPDGRTIYFARNEDGDYWILAGDLASGQTTILDTYCYFYSGVSLSPDGTTIATGCDYWDPDLASRIRLIDVQARSGWFLTENRETLDWFPAWSAGGGYLLFQRGNGYGMNVFRIPKSGGEPVQLTFGTIVGGARPRP